MGDPPPPKLIFAIHRFFFEEIDLTSLIHSRQREFYSNPVGCVPPARYPMASLPDRDPPWTDKHL